MALPQIFEVMGHWVGSDMPENGNRYIRRIEYVGEIGETAELRAYASRATAGRVHGDEYDCTYRITTDGRFVLHEEETARFRRGERLR
jgi:hypothetical protein